MNAILGKVGRVASEEVVLQLVASKCIPVLLYGLEACSVNKTDKASLDFTVSRFLMKLFNTNNVAIIKDCQISSVSLRRAIYFLCALENSLKDVSPVVIPCASLP
jgi:hypothetical protein